jgi:hypothetical protein
MDGLPLYRVQLEVDPVHRTAQGLMQVTYPVGANPLPALYLRATPNVSGAGHLTLSKASLASHPAKLEQPEPTLYRIALDPPGLPGQTLVLELSLAADVPVPSPGADPLAAAFGTAGPSASDHGAFSASPEVMGLVGIVPMVPALDEQGKPSPGPRGFGDLALYPPAHVLAAITVPRGYAVQATGEAMGEVPQRDGRVRFSFGAAAVRDFPVLVTHGYETRTASLDDLTIESVFDPHDRQMGERVLGYATVAAREMQKRLGPLPYRRFRVVEVPLTEGAGGMEFPGLVTIATSLYQSAKNPLAAYGSGLAALSELADAPQMQQMMALGNMTRTFGDLLELSVAHEVAHQWFSGLVGSDPIREPVVDEALAQYMAVLYQEWGHGKKAAERARAQQLVSAFQLYRLVGGADGAADRPTDQFATAAEYAALVYGKAPLLYEKQREAMGDAAFFQGLRQYVDAYRYRWSCSTCLTDVLAEQKPAAAERLKALQQHWWREAHGDEDLGRADLGKIIEGMTGVTVDPQMKQMLDEMLQLTH